MCPSSPSTGPQRKGDRRRGDLVFPQGRRTVPWIPGCWWTQERAAALCRLPPRSARPCCPRGLHSEGSSWRREWCWAPAGNRKLACLCAPSVPGPWVVHPARQRRAPWGLAWPGPAHLPGLRPAPRSARGHLARDRARRRDCRPPQQAGGPRLAPWRTGGGGSGRGCVVSCGGTQGGRGPRPPRQCWISVQSLVMF